LLFVLSAAAAARRFQNERSALVGGVIVPLAGALALLAILGATVILEDRILQVYAFGGVLLGIPFALWRGRTLRG
jgi:hypothetical protein